MAVKRWVIQRKSDGEYWSMVGLRQFWGGIDKAETYCSMRSALDIFSPIGQEKIQTIPVIVTISRVKPKGKKA